MDIKKQIQKANLNLPKEQIMFDEPMKKHTTFKIGGLADCLVQIKKIGELKEILQFANSQNIPLTVLGNGSNVLVLDKGIRGITLLMKCEEYQMKEEKERVEVIVDSGMKLMRLAQILLKNEITGMEELAGIPGTIGGAVRMNAGAHGKEMKDIVQWVKCVDKKGNEKIFTCKELDFSYRTSMLKEKDDIVIQVGLLLQKGNQEEIKEKMNQYTSYRKEKQPIEYPSAGSTFKRGNDYITAKLIDEAGLKGYHVGDAEVSIKHSGFVINKKEATAKDIVTLINYIKEEVKKKFAKEIELEIEIIGEE